MSLETERKRLQAQVRILEQQYQNRPSTSGSALIEKMQSRVNTVEDRLASKERQTQELEQTIQQQKDYISKFQSDLAHLMSLSSTGESAELVEKIRLAKLQLHTMIFPYTDKTQIEVSLQTLKEKLSQIKKKPFLNSRLFTILVMNSPKKNLWSLPSVFLSSKNK